MYVECFQLLPIHQNGYEPARGEQDLLSERNADEDILLEHMFDLS